MPLNPNPGDYMTLNMPGLGPIVVIRSRDGKEINAFVNICRHRGAMLLPEVRQAQNIVYGIHCAAHHRKPRDCLLLLFRTVVTPGVGSHARTMPGRTILRMGL